jgi:hypothetical protein
MPAAEPQQAEQSKQSEQIPGKRILPGEAPLRLRLDSALLAGFLGQRRRARRGDHEKGREQQSASHFRPPVRDRAWTWKARNRNGSGAMMFRLPNESAWSAQKQRPDPQPIRFID